MCLSLEREKEKCLVPTDTHREKVKRENLCDWGLNRKKKKETAV